MASNSHILKSISVSFENDQHLPNSCSVEINLQPNPPNDRDDISRGFGSGGTGVEVLEIIHDETYDAGCSEQRTQLTAHASLESRNDECESPLTAANIPENIFRRNDTGNVPETNKTTTLSLFDESTSNQNPNQLKKKGNFRNDSNDRNHPPANLSKRRTFQSSVSYDGLFEVRKSQSSRLGVTLLADGEGARSINLLYDELRKISTASIASADEALDKESFVGIAVSNNTDVLSKQLSLLSKADDMLLEARKACTNYHHSVESENFNENSLLLVTEEQTAEDQWNNHKAFFHQKLKRTQSLDRVLSTKEVLDLATQVLQHKGKHRKRKDDKMDPQSGNSEIQMLEDSSSSMPVTTSEQAAILRRQEEKGSISCEDKKLRDTLLRIQASNLGLHSLSIKSSASDFTHIDDHEGSPLNVPSFIPEASSPSRDKALKRLDGIKGTYSDDDDASIKETKQAQSPKTTAGQQVSKSAEKERQRFSLMRYLWGGDEDEEGHKGMVLACGPGTRRQLNDELKESGMSPYENKFAKMATSLMRRNHERFPSFPETAANRLKADPRMRDWIDGQFAPKEGLPLDGSYLLGNSKTIVVHEIVRGNWTWCTAWSPDGSKLAIATETHHLAIIDTSTSVWRVTHDKRIVGPVKNDTTHSIRAIAWGSHFIAIGGTGNAVSILAPSPPYPILHTIKGTGFVGSLDWRIDSTVLAIGSRINKAMIVALSAGDDVGTNGSGQLQGDILETLPRKNWVNAVSFSPGGVFFAVGDAGGQLSIFRWVERGGAKPKITFLTTFTMEDSCLAISFSPDGKWLYSGGEDMRVTIISTNHWEIVHRLRRNRWVQCVASSRGGTHVAVGGVNSEVSILEVGLGWDTVINIELKGLVPLSACWHPRDQFLALTGQNHSILVVETTNARHISGHFLRSISPVLAVDFSPDGRHAVIGNQQGVVTFFKLQGAAFVIEYEMVVTIGDTLCIRWSPDGSFVAIGSKNLLLIVGRAQEGEDHSNRPENASTFSIRKVMRGLGDIKAIAVSALVLPSQYIVTCGTKMEILGISSNYKTLRSFDSPAIEANAWSADGRWMATLGQSKTLTIYDTHFNDCDKWRVVVSLEGTHTGLAVAFGPITGGGLVYVAFGGDDKCITVVEIRTNEGTWETVLRAPRGGVVNYLDWNEDGLLAAAIGNGTVSVLDLSYLRAGLAVNEMDYKAQRQALTCFTEIRRNRGRNCMKTLRWIPCNGKGSSSMIAVGGTDGEVEIVDLSDRPVNDNGYK